jgi:N-acetylglucosaminyldiphosphoundecaprenol N-acetyl-beta-D-mannosaminyltransferase
MTRWRHDVGGTGIDAATAATAATQLLAWADGRAAGPRVACFANTHVVSAARTDEDLRAALDAADLVLPDGWPVAWTMRRLGVPHQRRVAGPDLMDALCRRAARCGIGIYCYGSTPDTLERLGANLRRRHPRLRILGLESPTFAPATDDELDATAERIATSGAGLVFVGLGAPRQEPRMQQLRARLAHGVLLGVGAAFDFHAGTARRAPRWMRRLGLEWLHRLASEPRRLLRRYLTGSTTLARAVAPQLLLRRTPRSTRQT